MESVSRQERKKLETRQRILNAAIELFREKGYEATTVDEIAERSDVAKATFFNHFPRKYALIMEVLEHRRARIQAAFAEEQVARLPVKMQLAHYLSILAAENELDPILSTIVLTEYTRSGDLITEDPPVLNVFVRTLERGLSRGEVKPDTPVELVGHLLWAHVTESYFTWVRSHCQFPLSAMFLEGLTLVFEGVAAR